MARLPQPQRAARSPAVAAMTNLSQLSRRAIRVATSDFALIAMPVLLAILAIAPVMTSGLLIME